MKPVRATLIVAFLSFLASGTAANAGCDDRPGTPTNLVATQSDNQVELNFNNTASESPIYWDVEVRDGAGNIVKSIAGVQGTRTTIEGGAYSEMGRFRLSPIQGPDYKPNTTYCFRVRARTAGGTQGCVSQIWGNQSCVTTPDTGVAQFCSTYARDAINQLNYLRNVKMAGNCGDDGERWSNDWLSHYNWCISVRGNPQSANWPDAERDARNQRLRVCSGYACKNNVCTQVVKPVKKTGRAPKPPAPPSPPPPPPPTVCAVNALVTVEQCYNLDGTPSQYYTPGSTQVAGCGTSEEEAINAAKASLGMSLDDDPAPGSCTFSKQIFGGVCACSPLRHARTLARPRVGGAPKASCAGDMKPNAAGRCGCPSGTSQNGFRCVAAAGGRNAGPGNGGTNGVYPNECPPGSSGTPPFCQLNADSNQNQPGAGDATQPQQAATCPPGSFGTPPFCQPGNGGTNGVYPNECPPGSTGTPPFCQQGNGGADGVYSNVCPPGSSGTPPFCEQGNGGANGVYPNDCPPGSTGTPPFCRTAASAPARPSAVCPPGTFGTPPFCTTGSGGTNMSMPGSRPSRVDSPRPRLRCPAGTFGRPPNCRRSINSKTDSKPKRVDRQCPAGSHGRYPHCRRNGTKRQTDSHCPRGTIGHPPNCHRPATHRPSRETQSNRSCPRGTVGHWPRCHRLSRPSRGTGGGHPPPIVVR